ncbi:hypothetical protein [Eubacterium sp. MSJ-33]|uniref:hypothetical protein n=1 Tax=Eubacterium sp. MSJ-33 TaxID=2841528 RepID=UPI001C755B65|nr:hypothetical protein [Eubacterium sp. MSJ-33]QWT53576.1 hypothetical protein KP625_02830 [Eubacterium sp. MSJ-33]
MMESKREKFVRLAEARTNKTIKMLQLIGNLSDRRSYEYSDKDISVIFNTIEKELKISRQKFETSSLNKNNTFKLGT